MQHTLFTSHIYQSQLGAGTSQLIRELMLEITPLQKSDSNGIKWSKKNYPGGYTSYGSIDELHKISSTFESLKKAIDKHVRNYLKILEYDIPASSLKMTTCWVNVMPRGASHTMHIHPLSVVSGSFYVDVPKNASSIRFEDPRLLHFMAAPPRKKKSKIFNRQFVEIQPKSGDVVLFESWMKHEVPRNTSQKNRISISFNYDWARK